jgi:hypothetical protein
MLNMPRLIFFITLAAICLLGGVGLQLAAQPHNVDNFCISPAEEKLTQLINAFRRQNRLAEIQLSASLSFVAKTHVADLQLHRPDTSICNTSSWSNKGLWTPCCYQPYVPKNECMWDKPKELTPYTFRGYELSYYEEGIIQVDSLWKLWRTTPEVVDLLLARGIHSDKTWAAFGVGISDNYASLWLGQRADPKGRPRICSEPEFAFRPPLKTSEQRSVGAVQESESASKFYLIYGSFTVAADAEEAMRRFRNAGFRNAQVVKKDNRIRVALDVFPTLREAMFAKERLSASYADAWILRD